MLYVQLGKDNAVRDLLNRIRGLRNICLDSVIIDKVGNIPSDDLNGYNVIKVTFTCSLIKSIGKKYNEYQLVFYEYNFNMKDNRISYDSDTAGTIIKKLLDNML